HPGHLPLPGPLNPPLVCPPALVGRPPRSRLGVHVAQGVDEAQHRHERAEEPPVQPPVVAAAVAHERLAPRLLEPRLPRPAGHQQREVRPRPAPGSPRGGCWPGFWPRQRPRDAPRPECLPPWWLLSSLAPSPT